MMKVVSGQGTRPVTKASAGPDRSWIMRVRAQGPPEQPKADQHDQGLARMLQRRCSPRAADRPLQDDEAAQHQYDGRTHMSQDQDSAGAKRPQKASVTG